MKKMSQKSRRQLRKEWTELPNREALIDAVNRKDASYVRGVLQVQERKGWSKSVSEYLRMCLSEWRSQSA